MVFAGRLQLKFRVWLLVVFARLVSAGCSAPPIPIRIGNVTLSTGETARGLDLSVGNPEQHFAFLPQWPLNNSFIYGTDGFCGSSWSTAACTTFRGGSYNQFASKSRGVPATNSYPSDASPYPQMNMVSENITLSSNMSVLEFPIGIAKADWAEQGYYPQMAMGLGANSTILNTLYSSGQIASRTWSMFWGRTGATAATQLDGGFIFGGYDRAKVTGANYTRTLTYSRTACSSGMLVTITNLVLNFPNGTDASMFGGIESDAIQACIEPSYPVLLTLPTNPYFINFEQLTNGDLIDRSFGTYYYGMLYGQDTTPYTGDLTIELDSGISVRIPNDQLVVPNLTVDHTSGAMIANASQPELVLNAIQAGNSNDLPHLGRQFLTAAYLMLNQDAMTFTLWQANPTENEDLVAVDVRNNAMNDFCNSPSTPNNNSANGESGNSSSTSSSSTPANTSTTNNKKSGTLSTGILIGVAVGSVAVIAFIAGIAAWCILRRRRNKVAAAAAIAANVSEKHRTGYSQSHQDQIRIPHYIPQELHAKTVPVVAWHELHARAVPATQPQELP
ncbi:putative aspartic-type endopeptidase [Sclerotinia borealis F-4128]|uniref:Putative aspartic-type endopeptidase n=1 Tax=Sclerotinia borealis (strain F-4128) TaxID=1432307 RepID=W9CFK7_SCLBF|nr:putative aspartic-type endopeptidase [Sclerotinia borealis F-4128]